MAHKVERWETKDGALFLTEKEAVEHEFLTDARKLFGSYELARQLLEKAEDVFEFLQPYLRYKRTQAVCGDVKVPVETDRVRPTPAETDRAADAINLGIFRVSQEIFDKLDEKFPNVEVTNSISIDNNTVDVIAKCKEFRTIGAAEILPRYSWVIEKFDEECTTIKWRELDHRRFGIFSIPHHIKENTPHIFNAVLKGVLPLIVTTVNGVTTYTAEFDGFSPVKLGTNIPHYEWEWYMPSSENPESLIITWTRKP